MIRARNLALVFGLASLPPVAIGEGNLPPEQAKSEVTPAWDANKLEKYSVYEVELVPDEETARLGVASRVDYLVFRGGQVRSTKFLGGNLNSVVPLVMKEFAITRTEKSVTFLSKAVDPDDRRVVAAEWSGSIDGDAVEGSFTLAIPGKPDPDQTKAEEDLLWAKHEKNVTHVNGQPTNLDKVKEAFEKRWQEAKVRYIARGQTLRFKVRGKLHWTGSDADLAAAPRPVPWCGVVAGDPWR